MTTDDHDQMARTSRRALPQALERLQALEAALRHLQSQIEDLSLAASQVARLRDDLAHLQAVIPRLQEQQYEELALLGDALRQRRTDAEQFRQATARLSREMEAMEAKARTLEERLQIQERRLRALEETSARSGEGLAHLEAQLEDLRRHLQQHFHLIGQLNEQTQKLGSPLEAMEGLREGLRQAAAHRDQLAQRLAAVEGSLSQTALEVQELSRHLGVAMDRAQEGLNRIVVLQREVDEQTRKLQRRLEGLLQLLQRQKRRQIEIASQEVKELQSGLDETP